MLIKLLWWVIIVENIVVTVATLQEQEHLKCRPNPAFRRPQVVGLWGHGKSRVYYLDEIKEDHLVVSIITFRLLV